RLFDFGRVDAEVAAARGRDAELLSAYRLTALRATSEVEVSLSDLVQSESRAAALQRQIDELGAARAQAQNAYLGGAISLIDVLDVDRLLLNASDQLALAQASACRAVVSSFRALGGGWSTHAT
ncbi:MAG TPA: TolC family protein, partial [Burkholderiaceae bacterium]